MLLFSLSSYDGNLTTVEQALAFLHESERYSVSHLGLLVSLSVFIACGRSAGLGYYYSLTFNISKGYQEHNVSLFQKFCFCLILTNIHELLTALSLCSSFSLPLSLCLSVSVSAYLSLCLCLLFSTSLYVSLFSHSVSVPIFLLLPPSICLFLQSQSFCLHNLGLDLEITGIFQNKKHFIVKKSYCLF